MRTSEKIDQIGAALARIQAHLVPIGRNKGVDVPGKDGRGGWSSRFATLDRQWEAVRPSLAAENIAIVQCGAYAKEGGERLETRLIMGDQWIESDFPVKTSRDGAHGYGGGMSFARRWGLCCMLGIVTAEDADEYAGYKDTRPARPQRAKAAPGLADRIANIANASSTDDLIRYVIEARSAHPLPDEATAVERAATAWFVRELLIVHDLDSLTILRDACNRVRPRGNEVREAIRTAETRLTNGQS